MCSLLQRLAPMVRRLTFTVWGDVMPVVLPTKSSPPAWLVRAPKPVLVATSAPL